MHDMEIPDEACRQSSFLCTHPSFFAQAYYCTDQRQHKKDGTKMQAFHCSHDGLGILCHKAESL